MSEFIEFVNECFKDITTEYYSFSPTGTYPNLICIVKLEVLEALNNIIVFACMSGLNIDLLQAKCLKLLESKRNDYANLKNRYSNFERTRDILQYWNPIPDLVEYTPTLVFACNMAQKITRIENLLAQNKEPENEPLIDSFVDLINYRLLWEGYKRGLQ